MEDWMSVNKIRKYGEKRQKYGENVCNTEFYNIDAGSQCYKT